MSILGKGSMRDKAKEEELRKSGEAKYFHLNDDLHVLIEVFAPPAEAYARMGHALEEIKKFLIPDYNDEIRQAQLQELTYLNGGSENADVPVVRGKPTLRTRGVPAPAITRGRGGVTARPVGVVVPRGTPTPRGVLSTRGPVSRGRGLLTPRARGVPPTGYRPPPPPPTQETYGEYDYDDGYGTAYDEQSYDSYDNSYSTPAQSGADYYDYGHGLSEETYDSYGNVSHLGMSQELVEHLKQTKAAMATLLRMRDTLGLGTVFLLVLSLSPSLHPQKAQEMTPPARELASSSRLKIPPDTQFHEGQPPGSPALNPEHLCGRNEFAIAGCLQGPDVETCGSIWGVHCWGPHPMVWSTSDFSCSLLDSSQHSDAPHTAEVNGQPPRPEPDPLFSSPFGVLLRGFPLE
ncbi:hypothetical protein H8959_003583, partial [Pygathrix nigripes]